MTRPQISKVEEEKYIKSIKDDSNHDYKQEELTRINTTEKEIPLGSVQSQLASDKRPNYHDQSRKRAERAGRLLEEHTQPVLH